MEDSFNSKVIKLVQESWADLQNDPHGCTVLDPGILDEAYAHIKADNYPERTIVTGKINVVEKGKSGIWAHFVVCNGIDNLVEGKFRVLAFRPFSTNKKYFGAKDPFILIVKDKVYREFIEKEGSKKEDFNL